MKKFFVILLSLISFNIFAQSKFDVEIYLKKEMATSGGKIYSVHEYEKGKIYHVNYIFKLPNGERDPRDVLFFYNKKMKLEGVFYTTTIQTYDAERSSKAIERITLKIVNANLSFEEWKLKELDENRSLDKSLFTHSSLRDCDYDMNGVGIVMYPDDAKCRTITPEWGPKNLKNDSLETIEKEWRQ